MFRHLLVSGLLVFLSATAAAQTPVQTVRGKIVDKQTEIPLPGAMILLFQGDSTASHTATSDLDGLFRLDSVPVGRADIHIIYFGYDQVSRNNIEITASKEIVLNVGLVESVTSMKEITVKGNRADQTVNKMVTNSARTFTVEEAERYAGSFNDVARMAQNFAGVQGADDSRNDIVIRGNSPTGVLYRLEGLDIPNPNHFARFGTTGGPVSMLNSNVLAKSDFMTGAFPASFGNATAGVFDLRMRAGNNEKFEFLAQVGINGFEGMAEGPLSRKTKASFLINYRYSTLELFKLMGLNFGTTAVPYYQDLTFKVDMPWKRGKTYLFGMGGLSHINLLAKEINADQDLVAYEDEDVYFTSNTGVVGLGHKQRIGKKGILDLIVGYQASLNRVKSDTLDDNYENPFTYYASNSVVGKLSQVVRYSHKFNSKHFFSCGVTAEELFINLNDSIFIEELGTHVTLREGNHLALLGRAYIQHQWRPVRVLTINAGLHYQLLTVGNQDNVEPRLGLTWDMATSHQLSLAYGLHSQAAPLEMYYRKSIDSLGNTWETNKNVDFVKSHHLVLGYKWSLPWNTTFKIEAYGQYIFDALVETRPSSYSLLNWGSAFDEGFADSLTNQGLGYNYGLELTVEKRMENGLYFMVNGSVFQSRYMGSDSVWRNTAFNGNFTANFLGGYEWRFGKEGTTKKGRPRPKHALTVDTKLVVNGSGRYTPVLLPESIAIGYEVRDANAIYEGRFPAYVKWNLRIGYKQYMARITQEWALDLTNVTNRKNLFLEEYDVKRQAIRRIYQTGFLPMFMYRITF